MAVIEIIDLGTVPNDGTGDVLRFGGQLINQNFAELNVKKLETGGFIGNAQDLDTRITNIEADYATLSTAQTFTGVKTFDVLPVSTVVPTSAFQLVNKDYVDNAIGSIPSSLIDLTDVSGANPAVNNILIGDGSTFAARQLSVADIPDYVQGIGDAPADGNQYARQDNAWVQITTDTPDLEAVLIEGNDANGQSIIGLQSIASNAGLFGNGVQNLRAFNVYGTGTNGRLSIQSNAGGNPGVEMTTTANVTRGLMRLAETGVDGTQLEFWTEVDGGSISRHLVMGEDGVLYIQPKAATLSDPLDAGFRNLAGVMQFKDSAGNWTPFNGLGASSLGDLSDVISATPTDRNVLVANGSAWESRALVEADISNLGPYDNYQSWNLRTNGIQRTTVQSNGVLDLVEGSGINLSYSAGGVVTIDFQNDGGFITDAPSDGNQYARQDGAWAIIDTSIPNLQQVTDIGNTTTNKLGIFIDSGSTSGFDVGIEYVRESNSAQLNATRVYNIYAEQFVENAASGSSNRIYGIYNATENETTATQTQVFVGAHNRAVERARASQFLYGTWSEIDFNPNYAGAAPTVSQLYGVFNDINLDNPSTSGQGQVTVQKLYGIYNYVNTQNGHETTVDDWRGYYGQTFVNDPTTITGSFTSLYLDPYFEKVDVNGNYRGIVVDMDAGVDTVIGGDLIGIDINIDVFNNASVQDVYGLRINFDTPSGTPTLNQAYGVYVESDIPSYYEGIVSMNVENAEITDNKHLITLEYFNANSGSGLQAVVDDLSPQLGGNLDTQTFKLFTNETVMLFQVDADGGGAGSITWRSGTKTLGQLDDNGPTGAALSVGLFNTTQGQITLHGNPTNAGANFRMYNSLGEQTNTAFWNFRANDTLELSNDTEVILRFQDNGLLNNVGATIAEIDAGANTVLTTKEWVLANAGGGIPDAPSDGNLYGRQDGAWEIINALNGAGNNTEIGVFDSNGDINGSSIFTLSGSTLELVGGMQYKPSGTVAVFADFYGADQATSIGTILRQSSTLIFSGADGTPIDFYAIKANMRIGQWFQSSGHEEPVYIGINNAVPTSKSLILNNLTNARIDASSGQSAVTKDWVLANAGGGIPDAPADGNIYGRQNNAWVQVSGGGIPDAPADGQQYARIDNSWQIVDTSVSWNEIQGNQSDILLENFQDGSLSGLNEVTQATTGKTVVNYESAFNGTAYVVVGFDTGSSSFKVQRSTNFTDWTDVTPPTGISGGVEVNNGRFFTIRSTPGGFDGYSSDDGVTWTGFNAGFSNDGWVDIAGDGNQTVLMISIDGSSGYWGISTNNGDTWTSYSAQLGGGHTSVSYLKGSGLFVAHSNSPSPTNRIITSPTGASGSWTASTINGGTGRFMSSFADNADGSIAVGVGGAGTGSESAMYSTDGGATWNVVEIPNSSGVSYLEVIWDGEKFVATGFVSGQPTGPWGNIATSVDGITWTVYQQNTDARVDLVKKSSYTTAVEVTYGDDGVGTVGTLSFANGRVFENIVNEFQLNGVPIPITNKVLNIQTDNVATKSFTVTDPINEILPLYVEKGAIRIQELRVARAGANPVQFKIGFGTDLSTIDTDIITTQSISSTGVNLIDSFSQDQVPAGEFVFLEISDAGSATQFHISIAYTKL